MRRATFIRRRRRVLTGGEAGYAATPVNFDGTNDYLNLNDDYTGVSDGKILSVSFWFRLDDDTNFQRFYNGRLGEVGLNYTPSSNIFRLSGRNVTPANVLTCEITSAALKDGNWHHFIASVNMADTGQRWAYIDDADASSSWVDYVDDNIDFTPASTPRWNVGSGHNGANKLNGDMADFWMRHGGSVIDLSVEANRRLFITSDGKPADPENWPTGGQVQLYGEVDDWHTNKGSGGGFTENGALTDGNSPVVVGGS